MASKLIISPHVRPPLHTLCPAHEVSQYGQRWKQWGPTVCSFSLSLQDPSEHLLSGDQAMAWDQPDKDPPLLKTTDIMYITHTYQMYMYGTGGWVSGINGHWFPKQAVKEQASRGVQDHAPPGNVFWLKLPQVSNPYILPSLHNLTHSKVMGHGRVGWPGPRYIFIDTDNKVTTKRTQDTGTSNNILHETKLDM